MNFRTVLLVWLCIAAVAILIVSATAQTPPAKAEAPATDCALLQKEMELLRQQLTQAHLELAYMRGSLKAEALTKELEQMKAKANGEKKAGSGK